MIVISVLLAKWSVAGDIFPFWYQVWIPASPFLSSSAQKRSHSHQGYGNIPPFPPLHSLHCIPFDFPLLHTRSAPPPCSAIYARLMLVLNSTFLFSTAADLHTWLSGGHPRLNVCPPPQAWQDCSSSVGKHPPLSVTIHITTMSPVRTNKCLSRSLDNCQGPRN